MIKTACDMLVYKAIPANTGPAALELYRVMALAGTTYVASVKKLMNG
jgi:hypothetical protein